MNSYILSLFEGCAGMAHAAWLVSLTVTFTWWPQRTIYLGIQNIFTPAFGSQTRPKYRHVLPLLFLSQNSQCALLFFLSLLVFPCWMGDEQFKSIGKRFFAAFCKSWFSKTGSATENLKGQGFLSFFVESGLFLDTSGAKAALGTINIFLRFFYSFFKKNSSMYFLGFFGVKVFLRVPS